MKVSVKVDYAGIIAMARELARYSATTYEFTLKSETASIIKIAALRAKIASVAKIKRDVVAEANRGTRTADDTGLLTVNNTRSRGRVWFVAAPGIPARGPGGTFRLVYDAGKSRGWHLGPSEWTAYLLASGRQVEYVAARTKELLARRGLMRLSWLQIGDHLGVPLASVSPNGNLQESIARAARGPGGRRYVNGRASVSVTGPALVITVRNVSPLAIKNQGQEALDRAIAQRLAGFRMAVKKNLLSDLTLRATRWKGIFVSP